LTNTATQGLQTDGRSTRLAGDGLFDWPQTGSGLPRLHGARCRNCGEVVFPFLEDCPLCMEPEVMDPYDIPGRGTLKDFVVTHRGPSGFQVPYVQAFVKLDAGPVIYSMLTGVDPTDDGPVVGMRLEMILERVVAHDEEDLIGWKFRPVQAEL
jgi:uncharacterized OB-fold protein